MLFGISAYLEIGYYKSPEYKKLSVHETHIQKPVKNPNAVI